MPDHAPSSDGRRPGVIATLKGPSKPTQQRAAEDFPLVSAAELLNAPAPLDELVEGLFERGRMGCFFGQPSVGKSFLAIDVAASIATGTPFHGRRVQAGPVVYLAGEGLPAMGRRLLPLALERGMPIAASPLLFSTTNVPLSQEVEAYRVYEAAARLAERLGAPPMLFIVDTWARHFAGDENLSQDVGSMVAACDRWLVQPFRATCLFLHHSGLQDPSRGRGSSTLRAALDFEFRIEKTQRLITVSCTKSKDCEPPADMVFELIGVTLPWVDRYGRNTTSAMLRLSSGAAPAPSVSAGLGRNQREALQLLGRLLDDQRRNLRAAGLDESNARVRLIDWREASRLPRARWSEVEKGLIDRQLVRVDPPYVIMLESTK